jgi:hypothetical protein
MVVDAAHVRASPLVEVIVKFPPSTPLPSLWVQTEIAVGRELGYISDKSFSDFAPRICAALVDWKSIASHNNLYAE